MRRHQPLLFLAALASTVSAGDVKLHEWLGAAGSQSGTAVAAAGDVDQDGVPDVLVGAPSDGASFEGSARVFSGKTGLPILAFVGSSPGSVFGVGFDVDGAGDVDQDGHPDLLIGAPYSAVSGSSAGRAVLVSGKTGGTLIVRDGVPGALLGASVAAIGDVNQDGFVDLAVGAPLEGALGAVRVVSGADGSDLLVLIGTAGVAIGGVVEAAGDLDADGVPDVALGNPAAGPLGEGRVLVHSGQGGALLMTFTGTANLENLGRSIRGGVDVDQDGRDDLVIGAPGNTLAHPGGHVDVRSGQDGSLLLQATGDALGDRLGYSLGGLADVNGDGVLDLVAGASLDDAPGEMTQSNRGSVKVISTATAGHLSTYLGAHGQEFIGYSAAVVGDVNGDGLPDYASGGWSSDLNGTDAGRTILLSGRCASTTDLLGFGAGCGATFGTTPLLQAEGCFAVGCTAELALTNAAGFAGFTSAAFLFGATKISQPLPGGCELLVGNVAPQILILPLLGSGPGLGHASFSSLIPPSLGGTTFVVQAFAGDLIAPLGFSVTNGLEIGVNP